jgi:uncharacterized C2H2 Zn-finger protein
MYLVVVSTEQSQPRQEVKNDTVSCSRCDKTFDTLQEYIEHKNLHNAQDPDTEGDELHCAHCDAVFTSQAVLYKHIQNQSRPVKSPSKNNVYCNKMMEDEYTGHNHMANFSLSQPHLYEGSYDGKDSAMIYKKSPIVHRNVSFLLLICACTCS